MAYTVKKGDTLGGIAKKLGTAIGNLTGYRSGDQNKIYEGETISIKGAETPKTNTSTVVENNGTVDDVFIDEEKPETTKSKRDEFISGYAERRAKAYEDALAKTGIEDVRKEASNIDREISRARKNLTKGIEKVSDNPFQSAATLTGRIGKMQGIAGQEIANLAADRKSKSDLIAELLGQADKTSGFGADQDSLFFSAITGDLTNENAIAAAKAKSVEDMLMVDKNFANSLTLSDREFANQIKLLQKKAAIDAAKDNPPATTEDVQKTLDQIAFVKQSINRANEMADASGASGVSKWWAENISGAKNSNIPRLAQEIDTIKTNILTAMVDPAVKKFFGPQMTNRDVELMTSGGTSLNPDRNDPAMMREELARVLDLYDRMETAVRNGTGAAPTTKSPLTPQPIFKPNGMTYSAGGVVYKETQDGLFEVAN